MNPLTKIYTTNKEKFEETLANKLAYIGDNGQKHLQAITSHNKQLVLEILEGVEKELHDKLEIIPQGCSECGGVEVVLNGKAIYSIDEIIDFLHSAKEEILADK